MCHNHYFDNMTYKEYFQKADFAEVWKTLCNIYREPEDTRPLYQAVHQSVCEMEEDKLHSNKKIEVSIDPDGDIYIKGAPDPQEWLVGRAVESDFEVKDVNEMVGHLLYWSTLYGIKTQKLQRDGFSKWLDYGLRGPFYHLPNNDFENIDKGVMVKYIFLDFDGVLNTEQYQAQLTSEEKPTRDEYGPLFDPQAVARLTQIVEATKAEIFIISAWGEVLGQDKVIEMWKNRGLPGEVRVVYIPDEKCSSKTQWIKKIIGQRIFLPYVILDAESQFLQKQEKHFIKVNPVSGISKEIADQSIKLLNALDNLPPSAFDDMAYEEDRERVEQINAESCEHKKLRYWKRTILHDEAYDWSWNFAILRKKLEYNIGYYRYTQRYVGWETDVERMLLVCKLMDIAIGRGAIYGADVYVNIRNCERFKITPAEFKKDAELVEGGKNELREEKAYQLVWSLLRQNMKKWWD